GCAQASLAYSCRLAASLRPTRTGRSHLRVGGYNEKCPALCACVFSFKGLAQASLACPCRLAASLSPHTQAAAICGWEATTKDARHGVPVFFHLKDSLKQAWRAPADWLRPSAHTHKPQPSAGGRLQRKMPGTVCLCFFI